MTQIPTLTRRSFIVAVPAMGALAACSSSMGNGVGNNNAAEIDARVERTKQYLVQSYPGTQDLVNQSKGALYMPLMTKAGLFVAGTYGRGALQIAGATVDYYSATSASFGIQVGAAQYAEALFFMTDGALEEFRRSNGWVAGADLSYATPDQGGSIGTDTTRLNPVVALVYGQQGFIVGASVEGTKYTRIVP